MAAGAALRAAEIERIRKHKHACRRRCLCFGSRSISAPVGDRRASAPQSLIIIRLSRVPLLPRDLCDFFGLSPVSGHSGGPSVRALQ